MGYSVEDSGASRLQVVIPSNTDLLTGVRALWIGNGGDVAILATGDALDAQPKAGSGTVVVLANVPSGSVLPISARKVMSTSTTATSVVALK